MSRSLPIVLADADNTLWDTDAVFADAQLEMLLAISSQPKEGGRDIQLAYVRQYDQALAKLDHRHLRYPPVLLAKALALGEKGVDPLTAAQMLVSGQASTVLNDHDIESIVASYTEALSQTPQLLPGVTAGLSAARQAGVDVWILTEGAADRQRERARALEIDTLVKGVSEVAKSRDQFARQRRRYLPALLFVIGDQPDRDIIPAQAAGCIGVLVPSRFRPLWLKDSAWREANFVADRFDTAINWILAYNEQQGPTTTN